ncbi:maleylpyruvate isomerase family mycothiol-dependent enzyme [Sphaerisporangium fuscum]|uniref:maleylpyruvate isomerase family mycothiol-dependent enzyme n=1 Tax=Sphaerisporangium fuscum TaxID=2835868 RepID=UPI001BDBDB0B|nr:maleylpyruvate isomerase family mycothiol-dependent enzyme [Sphaerisporangium fuscum]
MKEEHIMDIKALIAAERRDLAEMLEDLPPAAWDAPTLCAGWRVREVAAHMSLGFRYPLPKILLELVKARGDVNRMADRRARQDAATMPTAELVSAIRDNAHHPWKPPVGGITAALGHDVVHGRTSPSPSASTAASPKIASVPSCSTSLPGRRSSSARTSTASSYAPTTWTGPSAPAPR